MNVEGEQTPSTFLKNILKSNMRDLQIGSFDDMTFLMMAFGNFVVCYYCYIGHPNFYFLTSNNLKINDN